MDGKSARPPSPVAYRQRPGHERRQLLFQSTEIHNYRFTIVVFAYALKIRFKIEFSSPRNRLEYIKNTPVFVELYKSTKKMADFVFINAFVSISNHGIKNSDKFWFFIFVFLPLPLQSGD